MSGCSFFLLNKASCVELIIIVYADMLAHQSWGQMYDYDVCSH